MLRTQPGRLLRARIGQLGHLQRQNLAPANGGRFLSSQSEREKPLEQESTQNASAEEKALFEELLQEPGAFDRDDNTNTSKRPRVKANQAFGGKSSESPSGSFNRYASELNQEWDERSDRRSDAFSSQFRGGQERESVRSSRGGNYRGEMTPNEAKIFTALFEDIFAGGPATGKKKVDDGGFGSSFRTNLVDRLSDLSAKATPRRAVAKRKEARERYLSSVLAERVAAESISEEELEAKIDEAREEIVACQSVHEIWSWAGKNVWGTAREAQVEKALAASEAAEIDRGEQGKDFAETSQEKIDDAEETVRFGMDTPYYAPVLLLLLVNLRERFKSPRSALAILRVARNLGPDSFVLGCSPQLYAEMLRTQWSVLHDLLGARDTLREAKDSGILSSIPRTMNVAARRPGPDHDEMMLRDIVAKMVKNDVRRHVVDGTRRLPAGQNTPEIYERMLQLVTEMDNIAGSSRRRFPPRSSYESRSYDSSRPRRGEAHHLS